MAEEGKYLLASLWYCRGFWNSSPIRCNMGISLSHAEILVRSRDRSRSSSRTDYLRSHHHGRRSEVIKKKEALELIKGTSRYSHALAVSAMMKALARRLGKNEDLWELVGLLHDLDYDVTRSDMSKHGLVSAKMLKGRLPEHELYAIKAHDYRTGFKPKTSLDCALVATDTLAVFLEKTTNVTAELTVESILSEIDSASESQPWIKSNLRKCKALKIGLNEFLEVCLPTVKKK